MKVDLHPMFTGLSGKLGILVYVTMGKEMVDGKVIKDSFTYAKQKGVRTAPTSIEQDNIVLAFITILVNKFNLLKLEPQLIRHRRIRQIITKKHWDAIPQLTSYLYLII